MLQDAKQNHSYQPNIWLFSYNIMPEMVFFVYQCNLPVIPNKNHAS